MRGIGVIYKTERLEMHLTALRYENLLVLNNLKGCCSVNYFTFATSPLSLPVAIDYMFCATPAAAAAATRMIMMMPRMMERIRPMIAVILPTFVNVF